MEKTRQSIAMAYYILVVGAAIICIIHYLASDKVTFFLLFTIVWFVLTFSVLHLRRTIKRTNYVFPNDNLICLHVWLLTFSLLTRILRSSLFHNMNVRYSELDLEE